MHYHEAFWVVTGTAAPVIGLALTVAVGDILRKFNEARTRMGTQVWPLWSSYAIAGCDFTAMCVLLILSLVSLAIGSNVVSPILAIIMGGAGLLGVYFVTFLSAFVNFPQELREQAKGGVSAKDSRPNAPS